MRTIATICARTSSRRLPGKVVMPVLGVPALARLTERLKKSKHIDDIIIATSDEESDNQVASLAEEIKIKCFRGSLDDVLGRVCHAALTLNPDIVVEVTGDMILLDHSVIDKGISLLKEGSYDFVTNVMYDSKTGQTLRSYPIGVNSLVFKFRALEHMNKNAKSLREREHVSLYADLNKDKIKSCFFEAPCELSYPDWRFALDYQADYEFICRVYEELYPLNSDFSYEDIIDLLKRKPEILSINHNE